MDDSLGWHMVPCLNLVETIDLSRVSRTFNIMVQQRVGLTAPEILRLRRILRSWKHIRRRPPLRNNSWTRRRYNPDDRVIF